MHLDARALVVGVLLLLAARSPAATFELNLPPKEGEKYKSADFRLWLPDDVKQLRGILVRQHGCGRKGIDHADDVQWQALAAKWDCALLGTHFQHTKACDEWSWPTNGSERAFLEALKTFAEKTKHPELAEVPWALWGHSGGAYWAVSLSDRHPERVVGIFARSGGNSITDKSYGVPILFNYGIKEKTGRFEGLVKRVHDTLDLGRPKGALWGPAVDPQSEHDCRHSRQLAIPYLDAVLALRLSAEKGNTKLNAIDPTKGWYGDPETLAIAAAGKYKGDKTKSTWLPDEATAKVWQEYCKTGEVSDKTPPPAPTDVKVLLGKDGVMVTWQAQADLHSGIKHFHVYRDGKKIGSVGGEVTKANTKGLYQVYNYGDEPEPRPAMLKFIDKQGDGGAYQVTVENHAGLESPKSAAAKPAK